MSARLMKLEDLRPTDNIREGTISFLYSIGIEKTLLLCPLPQVWETSEGILIAQTEFYTPQLAAIFPQFEA